MTVSRRIYTKEFRINATKLVVDEHRPATSVAEEFNVSPKTLHSWVKQYRAGILQAMADNHDSVTAEQAETARLRAELQKARAEVFLLKKNRGVPLEQRALKCAFIQESLGDFELKGIPISLRCQILEDCLP